MKTITAKFKIVTPLFLGGAEPDICSELRIPSIKGAMRFWYRAIDPGYDKIIKAEENQLRWEGYIFGDAKHCQSSFSLRLDKIIKEDMKWDPKCGNHNRYDLMNEDHPDKEKAPKYSRQDTWLLNGLRYLSYSFNMGENKRKCIPAGAIFTVTATIKKDDEKIIKAVLASLWLLGHVGGLGSRSRRGFGTVALLELTCEGYVLPVAHGAKNTCEWKKKFTEGKDEIKKWFQNGVKDEVKAAPDHSVFNENSPFFLYDTAFSENTRSGKDRQDVSIEETYASWEEALNAAGVCMQLFRQRWDINDPKKESDYYRVKAHLETCYKGASPSSGITLPFDLNEAPERVAFGLPLTFRYGSLSHKEYAGQAKPTVPNTTFQSAVDDRNRSASPIHIRIVEIDGKCHPLFIRMNAPLLKNGDKIKDSRAKKIMAVKSTNILTQFWHFMMKAEPNNKEVLW